MKNILHTNLIHTTFAHYAQKEHPRKNVQNTQHMPHGTRIPTTKTESFNYTSKCSFHPKYTHHNSTHWIDITRPLYMLYNTVSCFFTFSTHKLFYIGSFSHCDFCFFIIIIFYSTQWQNSTNNNNWFNNYTVDKYYKTAITKW